MRKITGFSNSVSIPFLVIALLLSLSFSTGSGVCEELQVNKALDENPSMKNSRTARLSTRKLKFSWRPVKADGMIGTSLIMMERSCMILFLRITIRKH